MTLPLLLLLLAVAAPQPPDSTPPPPPGPASPAIEEELPSHPLGPLAVPDFVAPGDPLTLTDLDFHLSDTVRTTQSFGARVKFKDLAYLGAFFDGERRGLTLTTHRLEVSASDDNGSWDLTGDFRARRFVLSSVVRGLGAPGGRLLEEALAFRLTREIELQGWVVGDTGRPDERFLREMALGAFWQHAAGLEATAQLVRTYESTAAGENRRDTVAGSALVQLGPAELSAGGTYEDTEGRFPRRDGEATGLLRLSLAPRLLVEGQARGRFEAGAGTRLHEYRGALTWFGRRFTLPRAGELGRRAVALARDASDRGEYELSAFDLDGQRAQRERLALSPRREAFRADMVAEYRAEVAERPVPLAGLELRQSEDALVDSRRWSALAFLGVPWPPALPWRASPGVVPFLRLDLEHAETTTATSFRADEDTVRLTVSLSREMDLVARFTRTEPTALDIIEGIGSRHTFELFYVYARGR